MPQSFDQIQKNLKAKSFAQVYLLHGDEPFYIEQISDFIENHALTPADRSFNQYVLFGKDLNVPGLLTYAKRFPMMSEKQLILVKEAQAIQGLESKDQTRFLEDYLRNPLASTILVLCFKEPVDERKAWVKAFDQKGVLFSSKKLYDNKLPDWVANYCHERGVKVSRKAIEMLVEFVGNDLKRLVSEIDKILLNLTVNQEITADTIEKFVGVSKEYNIFEFQKALIQRDVLRANRIASFFAANPKENPLMPIIIVLFNFFSKLLIVHATGDKSDKNLAVVLGIHPFFAKDYTVAFKNYSLDKNIKIIHYLREADLQAKGVDAGAKDEADILKSLVFSILH